VRRHTRRRLERALLTVAVLTTGVCGVMLATGVGVRDDPEPVARADSPYSPSPTLRTPEPVVSVAKPPKDPGDAEQQPVSATCLYALRFAVLGPIHAEIYNALVELAKDPNSPVGTARVVDLLDQYQVDHLAEALDSLDDLGVSTPHLREATTLLSDYLVRTFERLGALGDGPTISRTFADIASSPAQGPATQAFVDITDFAFRACVVSSR
jgi:hypothetical protein